MRADPARGLGDALLDQPLVAGIGNIFKSEACFAARVDPWRPVGDLSDEELRAVIAAAREQMLDAVARGRNTFAIYRAAGPARAAAAACLARPGRRQPHHLLVPALPGEPQGAQEIEERTAATAKPKTVINPAGRPASRWAAGIIESISITSSAPAAKPLMAACRPPEAASAIA